MVNHAFTLHALCREWDRRLAGAAIRQVYTQNKELCIELAPGDGIATLSISAEPAGCHAFLREEAARAKRNSTDLFPRLPGKRIARIAAPPRERAIEILLDDGSTVAALLYGTSGSNVILTEPDGTIADAFHRAAALRGERFAASEGRPDDALLADREKFAEALHDRPGTTAASLLKRLLPHYGAVYIKEALWRARIGERDDPQVSSSAAVERLRRALLDIGEAADAPSPRVYFSGSAPNALALAPLQSLGDTPFEEFPTVNEAVRAYVFRLHTADRMEDEKRMLEEAIAPLLDRARRTLDALERNSAAARPPAEYERMGSILLASLSSVPRGAPEVTLPDLFSGEGSVTIPLDPQLTPAQNAERYFSRSKRSKASRGESEQKLRALRKKTDLLAALLHDLESCRTGEDLARFRGDRKRELASFRVGGKRSEEAPFPFRRFAVSGGFEVWVGKNSAGNDLLTFVHARPHDLWFHARGASGSHTLMRVPRGSAPGRDALREAAAIAAYYSKMRKAMNVPVAYCERIHVKKPKGAPRGTVVMDRETVLFVRPSLP